MRRRVSSFRFSPWLLLAVATPVLACQEANPGPVGLTRLAAAGSPQITRGPYLQSGRPTGIVIRWRTDEATDSAVRYGATPGALTSVVEDATETTEHIVTLSQLSPGTKYHYAVGTRAAALAGDDAATYFLTPPAPGTAPPVRIWAIGDGGTANRALRGVKDSYERLTAARHTDVFLLLGDNAYDSGRDTQYSSALFGMFPALLRRSLVWPTIGNHDTNQSSNPPATTPYFNIFSLPAAGEAGGLASGSQRYYAFDHGNIHFVCLDSMSSSRAVGGAMLTWLRNDLAADTHEWLIAFWHHPPYSKGSHDSDTSRELYDMRRNALPVLEAHGVDLVLAGHSHAYERSYLLDGHYGASTTLTPAMKKNATSGRADDPRPYSKPSRGPAPHEGTVYVVAGSASEIAGGALNHPAMFIELNHHGSVVIDVDGSRLDARFLRDTGAVEDSFTIVKGEARADVNEAPVVALRSPETTYPAAPATVVLTATVSDSDGKVARVTIESRGSVIATLTAPPWTFTWAGVKEGKYAVTARATDDRGASTVSLPLDITVRGKNVAPEVSLVADKPTYAAPAIINMTATATDKDGKIVAVTFFVVDTELARLTATPYRFPWSDVSEGTYQLFAEATDDIGATTRSAPVMVMVESPLPCQPKAETCNLLDDDCNGTIDDGITCADAAACSEGVCPGATDDAAACAPDGSGRGCDAATPEASAASGGGCGCTLGAARETRINGWWLAVVAWLGLSRMRTRVS